jgi:hypothetical protein
LSWAQTHWLIANNPHFDEYTGEITNRSNIGLTDEALKELWDAVHLDNPLVFG